MHGGRRNIGTGRYIKGDEVEVYLSFFYYYLRCTIIIGSYNIYCNLLIKLSFS